MFFENEKENISKANDLEITDTDGSVSWDAILDETPKKKTKKSSKKASKAAPPEDDLGLDLDLESFADDDTEVDEEELARILNEDNDVSLVMPKEAEKPAKAPKASKTSSKASKKAAETKAEPEPEVKAQSDEAVKPIGINKTLSRYTETKKSGSNVILILILLILVVGAAGYFAYSYLSENGIGAAGDLFSNGDKKIEQDVNTQDEIPVVNEDEADSELQEEKQEVVNVIPTGRDNPFMPLSKYVSMSNFNPEVNYDRFGIPKPPKDYGEQSDTNRKLMTITVTGIMFDEQKPSAIISYEGNDYFVQKGDRLDDFKVVDIGRSFVKIAYDRNIYKAQVGQTFGEFYGNSTRGNSRQYYSSEDVYNNRNSAVKKYMAETDVSVNVNTNTNTNPQPPAPDRYMAETDVSVNPR